MAEKTYRKDERAILDLGALYESYGYKKYKMSRFEEYGLYLQNKNFLKSDGVITFNDGDGRLLALKPDVTLSIVKNCKGSEQQKLFYTENVYRTSRKTHEFEEIMQVGLEYIGQVDLYSLCEVLLLAERSLSAIGGEEGSMMDISHVGFIAGLFDALSLSASVQSELLSLFSAKNAHEIFRVCLQNGVPEEKAKALSELPLLSGSFGEVLSKAEAMADNPRSRDAVAELAGIYRVLSATDTPRHIGLDFSVVNDISYYNGVIFQGYVRGVPCSILSGGRYDSLMQKMGKEGGAVGFAVYLDLLNLYDTDTPEYDTDVLLLYDDATPAEEVARRAAAVTAAGERVCVRRGHADGIKYRRLIDLQKKDAET